MDVQTQRTAQVLIDFYAGFAASDDLALQEAAFATALSGFQDTDAFSITMVGKDEANVDITRLLIASGVTLQWLVDRLASASGRAAEEIVFELRHFIESQGD